MALNGVKAGSAIDSDAKADFSKQSKEISRQISSKQSWTIDPHSKHIQRWDVLTTVALLFTATVTPFEVALLEPSPLRDMITDPLSWANRIVDLIFVFDIVLQCFIVYQEPIERGGAWVYDNRKILLRYLTSCAPLTDTPVSNLHGRSPSRSHLSCSMPCRACRWAPLDVTTAIPIDLILASLEDGDSNAQADSDDNAGALQLVRMLRLVKLARIVRASRIFTRWQAYFGISFAMIALVRFFLLTTIMAHWLACLWVLVGKTGPDPGTGPSPDPHLAFGVNWLEKAGLDRAAPIEIYGVAVYARHRPLDFFAHQLLSALCMPLIQMSTCRYVAFSAIFSGSGGTIVPARPAEYYTQALMMLLGSSVWAYVISSGCGIIATLNPNQVSGVSCMTGA